MLQKVIRAGNSTAVTVPAQFVKKVGIKIGDTVKVRLNLEKGLVTYTFSGVRQLALRSSLFKKKKSSPQKA
jgi:antitoxin component of MazEF toxin-antitoxin module